MRQGAVFFLIFLGFAASTACALDDRGSSSTPNVSPDSGLGGGGGAAGSAGSSGAGGGSGGIPQACGGKCPKTNIKDCNAQDMCQCAANHVDLDPDPHAATCEAAINSVEVDVGVTHDFIGHLTIKLWGPTGTLITLMSRPGFAETSDDGVESGPSAQKSMVGSAPITFGGAGSSIETVGGLSGTTLCQGGMPCAFTPAPGAAAGPASLSQAFKGQQWSGTWKLCVGDSEAAAAGTLELFRVKVFTSAGAPTKEAVGLGLPIPDDGYNGSEGSMVCTTVALPPL